MEAEEKRRQRDVSIKYAVLKEDKTKVPICQASFLSIFCKYKDFLITIVTSFSYFCISALLFELFFVFFYVVKAMFIQLSSSSTCTVHRLFFSAVIIC